MSQTQGQKAALLDAIAQAGSKGAAAYQQAQQGLQGMNADAVRAALSNSVASNVPQEAQNQLSQTISQPYQNREATLTENQATSKDWFAKLGASQNAFQTNVESLRPALEASVAAKARGSGGGGRAAKVPKVPTPIQGLTSQYGSLANAQKAFGVQGTSQAPISGLSNAVARQLASQAGVPADLAQAWYPTTAQEDLLTGLQSRAAQLRTAGVRTAKQLSPIVDALQATKRTPQQAALLQKYNLNYTPSGPTGGTLKNYILQNWGK